MPTVECIKFTTINGPHKLFTCSVYYRISSASSGTSKLTFTGLRRDTPSDLRLTNDELIMTCTILCTADYCLETTQQVRQVCRIILSADRVYAKGFNVLGFCIVWFS